MAGRPWANPEKNMCLKRQRTSVRKRRWTADNNFKKRRRKNAKISKILSENGWSNACLYIELYKRMITSWVKIRKKKWRKKYTERRREGEKENKKTKKKREREREPKRKKKEKKRKRCRWSGRKAAMASPFSLCFYLRAAGSDQKRPPPARFLSSYFLSVTFKSTTWGREWGTTTTTTTTTSTTTMITTTTTTTIGLGHLSPPKSVAA